MSPSLVLGVTAPGLGTVARALDRSPARLGRGRDVELGFDYPWLSRVHLVFERDGAGWSVRREGRNEVRLNGAVLAEPRPLGPGDVLVLGPMTITVAAAHLGADDALALPDALGALTLELPLDSLFGDGAPLAAATPLRHLTRLGEAARALALLADPTAVAVRAAELALAAVGARAAAVVELALPRAGGAAAGRATTLGAAGEPLRRVSQALLERALSARSTITLDDPSPTLAIGTATGAVQGPREGATPSVLVSPLGAPSSGVLYLERAPGAPRFSPDDAVFATVLAQLVGSALAGARAQAMAAQASEQVSAERTELRREIARRGGFGRLVGTSEPMKALAAALAKVAPTTATVLISGETGSGKELVARELHQRSPRADGPFFALNCAALPDALVESELFGHHKGAFSGADSARRGLFELASGGTAFLDEVAELSLVAQAKLLRALEAKEILPLGAGLPIRVDVRVVAATHVDLAEAVRTGRFRQDLFHRLNLFPLTLPPLRARPGDVPLLVAALLEGSTEARRKRLGPPTPEALAALERHDWPGNVRELAHVVERAAILAEEGEALDVHHLPEELLRRPSAPVQAVGAGAEALFVLGDGPSPGSLPEAVADFERALIIRELDRDGWNRTRTAKRLGVSRRAFMEKLRRYAIEAP